MSPLSLHDWFCMKDGRSSFCPRLPEDAQLLFCHDAQIRSEVLDKIELSFATDKPIKMLICGDWGVGKTHLTYHIRWWLEQHQDHYPARCVVIEIGDIDKRSRFDEIVRPLLDELSLPFLIQLVHDYRGLHSNVVEALRQHGIRSHIADAFNTLLLVSPGAPPVDHALQAFEYLKGRKPSGSAAARFGQPLDQSQDFVDVLTAVGELYRAVRHHRLVFIADEATRLDTVEADDAAASHWVNANKLIFDNTNRTFGFIYTVSGKDTRHLPKAIWDPQIQNRLGNNRFTLENLATADVEQYLRNLVDTFVDTARVHSLLGHAISKDTFSWPHYPFTTDARTEFVDYFNRSQENSKPRDISERLDELAFLALKQSKRLIDVDCLRQRDI